MPLALPERRYAAVPVVRVRIPAVLQPFLRAAGRRKDIALQPPRQETVRRCRVFVPSAVRFLL